MKDVHKWNISYLKVLLTKGFSLSLYHQSPIVLSSLWLHCLITILGLEPDPFPSLDLVPCERAFGNQKYEFFDSNIPLFHSFIRYIDAAIAHTTIGLSNSRYTVTQAVSTMLSIP